LKFTCLHCTKWSISCCTMDVVTLYHSIAAVSYHMSKTVTKVQFAAKRRQYGPYAPLGPASSCTLLGRA
jgi:transcription elongation factor Elf1